MAKVVPFNISIASLNFTSLSSHSSLANSCTFLICVWSPIKSLTQSTPATVPNRRMRVFFLARLKGRKIFGLSFLCLSCDIQDPSDILGLWQRENLEFLQDSRVCKCKKKKKWFSQDALYRRRNLRGAYFTQNSKRELQTK